MKGQVGKIAHLRQWWWHEEGLPNSATLQNVALDVPRAGFLPDLAQKWNGGESVLVGYDSSSSIQKLYNYAQHTVDMHRISFWLLSISEDENDAQVIAYLMISIFLCFWVQHGPHLPYEYSFLLLHGFILLYSSIFETCPRGFSVSHTIFTHKRSCFQPNLKVIKFTYEAVVLSQIPVTRTYFLDYHVGNQLHPYTFERPYVAAIRQSKLQET